VRLTPSNPPEKVLPLIPGKTGTPIPTTGTAPELLSRPAGVPLPAAPQAAPVPPGPVPAPSPGQAAPEEALARLAQGLGLPREDLSTALLGFVRFFSLPLEPGLLHRLRREALLPRTASRPGGDAGALAASAAAAKGLVLTGEALEAYAAAIDPGFRDPPEGDSGRRQTRRDHRDSGEGSPEPELIKKAAEEAEAASPPLKILNRLPGKNQEYWMALPFSFSSGGVVFRVSLRILLRNQGSRGYEAERLALDILLDSRRWLFVMDKPQEAAPGLDVYVSPFPKKTSPETLEREIREALGSAGGDIRIKSAGKMPFFADSRDETLLSVNKEV
jgi:hypothetical protein